MRARIRVLRDRVRLLGKLQMLLIPWGTDAPVYHRPYATGGIILINCLVFGMQFINPELTDSICLQYGELSPLKWLTAVYAHGGFSHLIGNMIFLYIFGLIVEGKIGSVKFAVIYNAIGFIASAMIAFLMYFSDGGALGASCAIFGTMAIALIWAPSNEIFVKWIWVFFYRVFMYDFEVSVMGMCMFYILLNFALAAWSGFEMSSETAHLLGTLPGFAIGITMVLTRRVDCEGYDLIAKFRGTEGKRVKTIAQEKQDNATKDSERQRLASEYRSGMSKCEAYIRSGHYEMAIERFALVKKAKPGSVMPENWYLKLIEGLADGTKDTDASFAMMQEYLKHYSNRAAAVRLRMARHVINGLEQPRRGLKILREIPKSKMPEKQMQLLRKLARQANKLIEAGVIELGD